VKPRCATRSTGFNQDVSVNVAPPLTVGFEQSHCSGVLTSGVDGINELAFIVVTKHQFEHWVGCLVDSVSITVWGACVAPCASSGGGFELLDLL